MITGLIRKLKVHVMGLSRNKKLDHFYLLCDSTSKVLDVGVSANEHNNQVNLFLNTFRHSENLYTGLGIETLDKIKKKNPNKRFLEYDGKTFPFNDKEFDWIFSNAVIEHVGNTDQQLHFINEMLRVSKNVFLQPLISISRLRLTQIHFLGIGLIVVFINGARQANPLGVKKIYY